MNSKEDLLAAFSREPVEVPAGGKIFHILPLNKKDIRDINAAKEGDARSALVLARSLCSPAGARLVTDEDAASVADLCLHAIGEELFEEIAKLNRLGDHAKKVPSPATTS
jgi:hypothetical protein